MSTFTYTRIRPLDLLQVATDQTGATTLNDAIAAIQAHNNQTKECPKCKVDGVSTGWNTIPITGGTTKIVCTICEGYLKTIQTWMPDPNQTGNFIILQIIGAVTMAQNATTTLTSNVTGGTWASSDETKATINANSGLITGVAAGTTNITYTVNGYSTTIVFTVTA